jgi:signal transduction histidine kinase/CheY-like chemotaxis protein
VRSKDHLTKRLSYVSVGSILILSVYFIISSFSVYLGLDKNDSVEQFQQAALNGLVVSSFISCLLIVLVIYTVRKHMSRVMGLIKDKEIAEQKAEVKAKFLSTMSHEIRTPMNAVIGLTNIMLEESKDEDQKENLLTLKFSADLLLALINDVLDFSKLEAGEIHFEKITIDLHLLVQNIGKTLRVQADKKQIPLEINLAPDVPRFIVSDSVRLSQILTNLIGNAIKFTEKGKVSLTLQAMKANSSEATIRFSVRDTGIGIPADKFETIFQSFSQADAATTRKFGGTGLGLSITKRMLELQGSEIQIESTVGKGSNFFFDLTIPVESHDSQLETSAALASMPATIYFGNCPILLVEDNNINVMVALKFLKKWGLDVDVAENGQVALNKIQQKHYDLVLMDLDMPVMDGYEATKAIRASKNERISNTPVIALSASAVSDFREKAMVVGMNEYVTKPFKPEELYVALNRFLGIGVGC